MLCMLPDESFSALERKVAPVRIHPEGPKITGNTWAARKEAELWRELAKKKAAAQ